MKTPQHLRLALELLRNTCDADLFDFTTTDEIPPLSNFLGQERALSATNFGITIKSSGFNIFALGPTGIGKRSVIRTLLEKEAHSQKPPPDICYVHNFKNPNHPHVLLLQPGLGKKLARDMKQLVEILRVSMPAILESEAYVTRMKEFQEELRKKQEEAYLSLESEAEHKDVAILRTPQGFMLAATKNGEVIPEEAYAALPEKERDARDNDIKQIHGKLSDYLEVIQQWNKEQRQKAKEALQYFTLLEVGSAINDVKNKYTDHAKIMTYLEHVQQAIVDNPSEFRKKSESGSREFGSESPDGGFTRYSVNVLVDHSQTKHAPIVYEDNPTFFNLIGHIDYLSQFGALVTDFSLIRPGALHKANGGYLLLDALKLLANPYAWEALKRALRAKHIKVENIQQLMGFVGTISLEPEPADLDIKIIILGERYLYYLLCAQDPEFLELFKVSADFDEFIPRTKENTQLFVQLLKSIIDKNAILPLSKNAVARTIEFSSRLAGHSQKLSTHVQRMSDLLREAHYHAQSRGSKLIDDHDIDTAIYHQVYRQSRLRDESHELITENVIMIATEGEMVGHINGLTYLEIGGFSFGQPVRISAQAGAGTGHVIDIEREVKLSGPIHSKGVLILSGFLTGRFAHQHPLSLSASLVFEQSYGAIDGDSASLAEACVLLSAIANVPLKQSLALTGSLNQHGQVQAIGGVNEKIEGFYQLCTSRGLKGQGVIIPRANVEHLMLSRHVVESVKNGQFHIYAVTTIDEALELLTDLKAGTLSAQKTFPRGSFNEKVASALKRLTLSIKKAPK